MFQLEANDDYQRAIYSKLRIQALRLALVVQGLKDVDSRADTDVISGESAAAACTWCFHYFLPMALTVRSLITKPVQKQISTKEAILFIAQRNAFAKASEIAAMVDVSYSYVHKILTGER